MQRANALPQLTLASAAAPAAAEAAAAVGAKANNTFQFGLAFDRVRTATPASCCLVWSAWTDAHSACVCVFVCLLSVRVSLPPCVLVSSPLVPLHHMRAPLSERVCCGTATAAAAEAEAALICTLAVFLFICGFASLSLSLSVCLSCFVYFVRCLRHVSVSAALYTYFRFCLCAPRVDKTTM